MQTYIDTERTFAEEELQERVRIRDRFKTRIDRLPGPPLFKELLLWYSLTWPMLLIRTPLV